MRYCVLSGSPKSEGLCVSVIEEIVRGAKDGGAEVTVLTAERIQRCKCCGDGWGTCYIDHQCSFGGEDGFNDMKDEIWAADAVCVISPVYWHEVSEPLKAFMDRLRRCENFLRDNEGGLAGKSVLLVAVPGGSGNGALPCLDQMNRFCSHTKAAVFDFINVNRWNADYKRAAAYAAAKAMAEGRKPGETV